MNGKITIISRIIINKVSIFKLLKTVQTVTFYKFKYNRLFSNYTNRRDKCLEYLNTLSEKLFLMKRIYRFLVLRRIYKKSDIKN